VTRLAGPFFLLALIILFHWKLVFSDQFTWLESPDFVNQNLPWYQFQAGELHAGRLPLWDPYSWAGQPFLGQVNPSSAYPPHLLFLLLPLRNGWLTQAAMHWYYVLIHAAAALSLYAFARSLGRSRPASILGGVIYGLGGILSSVDWPQMMHACVWIPLVFLFQFRALRGERVIRNASYSGACLGAAWLCGHHNIPLFLTLASAAIWIHYLGSEWHAHRHFRPLIRAAGAPALAVTLMILLSAVQTLPGAEYGQLATRWVGASEAVPWDQKVPYNVHEQYSLHPAAVLGVFIPGFAPSYNPYVGFTAVALGLLGFALAWREAAWRRLAAIGLAAFLFALGAHSLFHGLLYAFVPTVEKARVPGMAMILVSFVLAAGSARAADALFGVAGSLWTSRAVRISAALGTGLLLLGGALYALRSVAVLDNDNRWMLAGMAALAFAAILAAAARRALSHAWTTALLTLLALCELTNSAYSHWLNRFDKGRESRLGVLARDHELAQFLRQQPGLPRIEFDFDQIPYNFGQWYGLETMESIAASMTSNLQQHDMFNPRLRDLLGVRYFMGRKPARPDQTPVFEASTGLKIYTNPNAFPRLWVVHQGEKLPTLEALKGRLNESSFSARDTVALLGQTPPALQPAQLDQADYLRRTPGHLVIQCELGSRGMLIVNDLYFPGWEATVDGQPAPIWNAYALVRGVVVEAGRHRVEMRYRPASARWGLTLSLAGLALLLAVVWLTRSRRQGWAL
jgi:hypothetical protein